MSCNGQADDETLYMYHFDITRKVDMSSDQNLSPTLDFGRQYRSSHHLV
jgi:hypothetical protein